MTTATQAPAMTVEIHDVTPALWSEVETIHAELAAIGVPEPTLLVVPAFEDENGRRWDLRESPPLASWLRAREEAGAELVQHGLTHRAPGPPPPGVRNAFMHHWFSRGCAEFAHLDFEQAKNRLALGRTILGECGIFSEGFVAPAWQQSPDALDALSTMGFRFTAFLNSVLPLSSVASASTLVAPALTFAAGHPWIDHGKRIVMRGLELLSRDKPLLRVALHPEDARGSGLLTHILRRISALLETRRVVRYADWLRDGGAA